MSDIRSLPKSLIEAASQILQEVSVKDLDSRERKQYNQLKSKVKSGESAIINLRSSRVEIIKSKDFKPDLHIKITEGHVPGQEEAEKIFYNKKTARPEPEIAKEAELTSTEIIRSELEKMGKSLAELSPEEKKKLFAKVDSMIKAKNENYAKGEWIVYDGKKKKILRKTKSPEEAKKIMKMLDRLGKYSDLGMVSVDHPDAKTFLKTLKEEDISEVLDLTKGTEQEAIKRAIDDFLKSDAPQFKGKTKEEKIEMAIAAVKSARGTSKNEELSLSEAEEISPKKLTPKAHQFLKKLGTYEVEAAYSGIHGVIVHASYRGLGKSFRVDAKTLQNISKDKMLRWIEMDGNMITFGLDYGAVSESVEIEEAHQISTPYHASEEPNSAVGYRRLPEAPKHADVVAEMTHIGGVKTDGYRMMIQYPCGLAAFFPEMSQAPSPSLEVLNTLCQTLPEDHQDLCTAALLNASYRPHMDKRFSGEKQEIGEGTE